MKNRLSIFYIPVQRKIQPTIPANNSSNFSAKSARHKMKYTFDRTFTATASVIRNKPAARIKVRLSRTMLWSTVRIGGKKKSDASFDLFVDEYGYSLRNQNYASVASAVFPMLGILPAKEVAPHYFKVCHNEII